MSLFSRSKHETAVTVYTYEVVEDDSASPSTDENDPAASTTSGNHCAWCGDPPDKYGSHGICAMHQAQVLTQLAERRRSRGRS